MNEHGLDVLTYSVLYAGAASKQGAEEEFGGVRERGGPPCARPSPPPATLKTKTEVEGSAGQ